jgi:hypothetical protein
MQLLEQNIFFQTAFQQIPFFIEIQARQQTTPITVKVTNCKAWRAAIYIYCTIQLFQVADESLSRKP